MESIDILVKEHQLIRRFLDILALAKVKLEKGGRPQAGFFQQAITFSKQYADQFHHFKEEYLMFGLLAQKEHGALDGQIGELRYQHERCRHCITEIEKSIHDEQFEMDEMQSTRLLEHLAGYISLLNRHIYREDHVFFPMAGKRLSREDDEYLIGQFIIQENNMGRQNFSSEMKSLLKQMSRLVEI